MAIKVLEEVFIPRPGIFSQGEFRRSDFFHQFQNKFPRHLRFSPQCFEKKEKKGQNPEGKWGRKPGNANDDLQGMSRDGSNERTKTAKGDGNTIKFQKETSHCLEENRYVMPRKIQIDKLPDHVKELLRV